MAKKITRLLALWFLMGSAYYLIEIIYRLLLHKGWPHPSMILVGGLCGIAVGAINQCPRFYKTPVLVQSIIGTVIVLFVEFCSGVFLNMILGLDIWDYSGLPGNVLGQICLPFALAWFLLMPFAIWLEDTLRWGFGWNGRSYSLESIYLDLIKGR